MCSGLPNWSSIKAHMFWIDKKAADGEQPDDNASKISEASNLPSPHPPFSSET
jgi:hypothetical protein